MEYLAFRDGCERDGRSGTRTDTVGLAGLSNGEGHRRVLKGGMQLSHVTGCSRGVRWEADAVQSTDTVIESLQAVKAH